MSSHDTFARVVTSLHEAALDDARWPATSALIDDACGIHGNGLLIAEGPRNNVRVFFVGLYYQGERREDVEREYLGVYHPIDERVPRMQQLPDSCLVRIADLYTAHELQTSRTYNELFRRAHFQDGLNVRVEVAKDIQIAWGLADPVKAGGWEAAKVARLEGLLPHLRQFVRVRQALVGAEALGASAAGLLDNTRIGVIHLDRRARILAANDRALAVLRAGGGLSDRDGELRADEPADHVRLERLLAGAVSGAGATTGGSMRVRRRLPESSPVVLHVKPVPAAQPDYGARRVAALVLLVEPGRPRRIDPTLVASTLGLTRAESEVAAWLAEGRTVRDIAVATGRKEVSVHWHLTRIYAKHGISRQAELVQLVLSVAQFA